MFKILRYFFYTVELISTLHYYKRKKPHINAQMGKWRKFYICDKFQIRFQEGTYATTPFGQHASIHDIPFMRNQSEIIKIRNNCTYC